MVYGSSQEDASSLKGYAVSVASAKKLSIVCEKFEKKNSGELKVLFIYFLKVGSPILFRRGASLP